MIVINLLFLDLSKDLDVIIAHQGGPARYRNMRLFFVRIGRALIPWSADLLTSVEAAAAQDGTGLPAFFSVQAHY
jgi:hypothetical protein